MTDKEPLIKWHKRDRANSTDTSSGDTGTPMIVWGRRSLESRLKMLAGIVKAEVLHDLEQNPTSNVISNTYSSPENFITKFSEVDPAGVEHKTPLSNFYPVKVTNEGREYPNLEAAYQGAKFLNVSQVPEDAIVRVNEILKEKGLDERDERSVLGIFTDMSIDPIIQPKIAKRAAEILGDEKYGLLRKDWRDMNLELMMYLLLQKFRHPDLAEYLRSTGSKYIIEGSKFDGFYGVKMDNAGNLIDGKNILGRALMNIRGKLDKIQKLK
ncbi:MAG TPA: NADAR family protein [Patescibacteria group bacterium]